MCKPRFVVETDEKFKKKVVVKAAMQVRTIREIVLELLSTWLKKKQEAPMEPNPCETETSVYREERQIHELIGEV